MQHIDYFETDSIKRIKKDLKKCTIPFDVERFKNDIKEKGKSINEVCKKSGYTDQSTFRAVLRKGEIPIDRLIAICNEFQLHASDYALDESMDDILFILQFNERGLSIEDKREKKDYIGNMAFEDLLTVCRDLGYDITPLASGKADWLFKRSDIRSSDQIDNSVIEEILADTIAYLTSRLDEVEKKAHPFYGFDSIRK